MRKLFFSLVLAFALATSAWAQAPGDRVRLRSPNAQGVPVHPASGDPAYVRWSNGTLGQVLSVDARTGWIEVESAGKRGWVTARYVTVVPATPESEPEPEATEALTYRVATWNLEHFREGASRGFPENTREGPSYGPRTDADFGRIAGIVKTDLGAKVLVLNEINGIPNQDRSVEMDRLIAKAGPSWQYRLTRAGGSQRVALMYDTAAVRLDRCHEITVAAENADGKDIFDRDPLACLLTFLEPGGQARNDLVVVGVHLASGQENVANHNRAMAVLRDRLESLFEGGSLPRAERDVLIAGDFNASRYDNRPEDFWTSYDAGGFAFRTLAPEDGELYPGTRLAGVPLSQRSQIDYLLGSARAGGLVDELVQLEAEVHSQLLGNGFDDFRQHVSDHLPVSVRIRVVQDDD